MKNIYKYLLAFIAIVGIIFVTLFKFNQTNYKVSQQDVKRIQEKYNKSYNQELHDKRLILDKNQKIQIETKHLDQKYQDVKKEFNSFKSSAFNIQTRNYLNNIQKDTKEDIRNNLNKLEEMIHDKTYSTHQEVFNNYNDLQVLVEDSRSLTSKEKQDFIKLIDKHKDQLNNKMKNDPKAGVYK